MDDHLNICNVTNSFDRFGGAGSYGNCSHMEQQAGSDLLCVTEIYVTNSFSFLKN